MAEATLSIHPGWVRVGFGDGAHADFHTRWLRHNGDGDRHPVTRERTLCSSELPDALAILWAAIDGDVMRVRFDDASPVATYGLAWLRAEAYAVDAAPIAPPPSGLGEVSVDASGLDLDTIVARSLAVLAEHGVAIVRAGADGALAGSPEAVTEPLIAAYERARLRIVATHFGRIEDLRPDNTTNQNTDQLGYTDASIQLHTDQPFIARPPRYQILQAIRPADVGGDSFFVDALAAWRYHARLEAHEAELLRAVPVRFHRRQSAFESLVVAPIIAHPEERERFQVRYSYFTMAPHQVAFETMSAWYRAFDRYARIVRDPAHQYRTRLAAGDFAIYDNHRMLHARTRFEGPRWVRGIYLDPPE